MDGEVAEGEFTQDIAAEVDRIKQHNETKDVPQLRRWGTSFVSLEKQFSKENFHKF